MNDVDRRVRTLLSELSTTDRSHEWIGLIEVSKLVPYVIRQDYLCFFLAEGSFLQHSFTRRVQWQLFDKNVREYSVSLLEVFRDPCVDGLLRPRSTVERNADDEKCSTLLWNTYLACYTQYKRASGRIPIQGSQESQTAFASKTGDDGETGT